MVDIIKNNKRTVMISLVALIAILFIMIVIINATKAGGDVLIDNTNELYITNVSKEFVCDKTAENECENDFSGMFTLTADIYTKKDNVSLDSVDVTFKSDSKSYTIRSYVGQDIEYGETVSIRIQSDLDLSSYDLSYSPNYKVVEEPELPEEDNTDEGNGE